MPDDMIERVARAMWEDNRARCREMGAVSLDPWEQETDGLRDDWMKMTRVAMLAMRDGLNREIKLAIWQHVNQDLINGSDRALVTLWHAAFDAALTGSSGQEG